MGKNARVKWKSRRKFSQSRTFHSYPIGLHIIFSTSSCAKLAVYLVWWVASFLFKFSDKVCDISNLCNFLTMHVAYLSIQFSDNACDISVNPFYANEWDIRFLFYLKFYSLLHRCANLFIKHKQGYFGSKCLIHLYLWPGYLML